MPLVLALHSRKEEQLVVRKNQHDHDNKKDDSYNMMALLLPVLGHEDEETPPSTRGIGGPGGSSSPLVAAHHTSTIIQHGRRRGDRRTSSCTTNTSCSSSSTSTTTTSSSLSLSMGEDTVDTTTIPNNTRNKIHHHHRCGGGVGGRKNSHLATTPFPWQLHSMLEAATNEGFEHIVSWLDDNASFKVHEPVLFVKHVLPRFFERQSKYKSFQRQLNIWQFERLIGTRGPCNGGYCHVHFQRNKPFMFHLIKRLKLARRGPRPPPHCLSSSSLSHDQVHQSSSLLSHHLVGPPGAPTTTTRDPCYTTPEEDQRLQIFLPPYSWTMKATCHNAMMMNSHEQDGYSTNITRKRSQQNTVVCSPQEQRLDTDALRHVLSFFHSPGDRKKKKNRRTSTLLDVADGAQQQEEGVLPLNKDEVSTRSRQASLRNSMIRKGVQHQDNSTLEVITPDEWKYVLIGLKLGAMDDHVA